MTAGEPSGGPSPRLQALHRYDLLDTPPETGFDDLVRLASQICETPVSLVSLVADDRQWFKARIGLDLCETPLTQSVCRQALDQSGLLVIPDLTADPRTRDNTLVTGEPHFRFYAGARLETPDGLALGRLCVIDTAPRPQGLSVAQAEALEALARQTMALIEARRTAAMRDEALGAVRDADARHRQILESAIDYAIVTLDLGGLVTGWNIGAARLLGWTEPEMLGRPADIFFTAEDHRAGVPAEEMRQAREHGRGNDERWHQRKDGSRFWGLGEMMPLTADTGQHVGYLKIMRDRTEQRTAAEALQRQTDLLRTVTDRVSEAVFQLDTAGVVTFANPAAGTLLGWTADELVGRNLHETAHYAHPDGRPFPQEACEVMRALPAGLVLHNVEGVYFRRDGTPIDVLTSSAPVIEGGLVRGAVLTVVDVTLAKLANEQLRRVDERLSFAMQASTAVGWWDWDILADKVYASDTFAKLYGVEPASAAAGAPIALFMAALHPDDRDRIGAVMTALTALGGEFAEEYRLLQPDGSLRWVYARGRCYLDDQRRPARFPGVAVDITERKRSEQRQSALADLGDRLRDLSDPAEIAALASEIAGRTLGTASAAYGTVDQAQETIDIERGWCPDGVASVDGHRFADYGSYLQDLRRGDIVAIDDVEVDPRTRGGPLLGLGIRALLNVPVMERGRLVAVLCLLDTRPRLWSQGKLNFCRSVADRTRAALAKQRAEAAQELLNSELSHRMKNLLAMVQSIVNQTMRAATDVETARSVLSGRIVVLSQAHDLLLGGKLGDTTIEPVVRSALAIHTDHAGRVRLAGPDLRIGRKPALALALMLHELATNATKYGALSQDGGHVDVGWAVVENPAGEPALRLTWTEAGGPAVTPPSRKGFGSRFIERGLSGQVGGEVEMAFLPSGVRCSVTGPLAAFQSDD